MADAVVGIMWCKNEGDLLPHTISSALTHVDALMIADDDSTDNSWDVIKSFKSKLEYAVRTSDKLNSSPYKDTPRLFARQHLLDEVRRRFGTKNIWVQVIEGDVAILDTNVKSALAKWAVDDISMPWHMVNAVRRVWTPEYDLPRIPDNMPLTEFFNAGHWMEQLSSYTFRPLPGINYTLRATPWPQGFGQYMSATKRPGLPLSQDPPLVAHYGLRSPTFYYHKMKGRPRSSKYPNWDLSSPASIKKTMAFYNGDWNNHPRDTFDPVSREGWNKWCKRRGYVKNS